jgi:hypothetical protein
LGHLAIAWRTVSSMSRLCDSPKKKGAAVSGAF